MDNFENNDLSSFLDSILSSIESEDDEFVDDEFVPEDSDSGDTVFEGIPMGDLISVNFIKRQYDLIKETAAFKNKDADGQFVIQVIEAIIEHWRNLDDDVKLEWL